ncbi:hypothetical protein [Floridanema evergladense]
MRQPQVSEPTTNRVSINAPLLEEWLINGIIIKRHFGTSEKRSSSEMFCEQSVFYEQRFWQIEQVKNPPLAKINYKFIKLEKKFKELATQWKSETAPLSVITQKVIHPAYQQIIGMGEDVVPLLLRELEKRPDHWFWALKSITGANPVKSEHRGRIKLMAQDWLEWGRENGYKW